jgi:hypothetical protein
MVLGRDQQETLNAATAGIQDDNYKKLVLEVFQDLSAYLNNDDAALESLRTKIGVFNERKTPSPLAAGYVRGIIGLIDAIKDDEEAKKSVAKALGEAIEVAEGNLKKAKLELMQQVRDVFTCPVSKRIFQEPVILFPSRVILEKASAEAAVKENKCPLTNEDATKCMSVYGVAEIAEMFLKVFQPEFVDISAELLDKTAKCLTCPATGFIFRDPVILYPSGIMVEEDFAKYQQGKGPCPVTRTPVEFYVSIDRFKEINGFGRIIDGFLRLYPEYENDQYKRDEPEPSFAPPLSASSASARPSFASPPATAPGTVWTFDMINFSGRSAVAPGSVASAPTTSSAPTAAAHSVRRRGSFDLERFFRPQVSASASLSQAAPQTLRRLGDLGRDFIERTSGVWGSVLRGNGANITTVTTGYLPAVALIVGNNLIAEGPRKAVLLAESPAYDLDPFIRVFRNSEYEISDAVTRTDEALRRLLLSALTIANANVILYFGGELPALKERIRTILRHLEGKNKTAVIYNLTYNADNLQVNFEVCPEVLAITSVSPHERINFNAFVDDMRCNELPRLYPRSERASNEQDPDPSCSIPGICVIT